jgi:hypothetical protein
MIATVPNIEKRSSVLVVNDNTSHESTRVYRTDPQSSVCPVITTFTSISYIDHS